MWAGAHVRPIPGSTLQLLAEGQWLAHTYTVFEEIAKEEPWAGVKKLEGIEYLANPPQDYIAVAEGHEKGLYASMPGYKRLAKEELPEGVSLGFRYDTFCVNSPVYCSSLLRKFRMRGGKIARKSLVSEREAFALGKDVRCVINASGLGFGDSKTFPTRGACFLHPRLTSCERSTNSYFFCPPGQTCLVANPCPVTVTRQNADGTWTFIIPRDYDGGTIIGGTKEPHDWNAEPVPETREKLLRAAAEMYPAILNGKGEFDIITDVVGRRPTREGGMRIAVEKGSTGVTGDGPVVHAYGAGGRGFEISWGAAKEVCELVKTVVDEGSDGRRLSARI